MVPRSRESRFMLAIQVCLASAVVSLLLVQPEPGNGIVAILTALFVVLTTALVCRIVAAISDHVRVARIVRHRAH